MSRAVSSKAKAPPLHTPDGRYIIVRERLWRTGNPALSDTMRANLVHQLMDARRAVRDALRADDAVALKAARAGVQAAKVGLGERGPVWWNDDAKDYNRHLVKNTPYAQWFATRRSRETRDTDDD